MCSVPLWLCFVPFEITWPVDAAPIAFEVKYRHIFLIGLRLRHAFILEPFPFILTDSWLRRHRRSELCGRGRSRFGAAFFEPHDYDVEHGPARKEGDPIEFSLHNFEFHLICLSVDYPHSAKADWRASIPLKPCGVKTSSCFVSTGCRFRLLMCASTKSGRSKCGKSESSQAFASSSSRTR